MLEIHEEFSNEEWKHIRCYFRRVSGIALAAVALIVLLVVVAWSTKAHAEPVRGHPADCQYFTDMAVTARALAANGVDKGKVVGVFGHIYDLNALGRPEIAQKIINAAYKSKDEPGLFAGKLNFYCRQFNGDLTAFFASPPSL